MDVFAALIAPVGNLLDDLIITDQEAKDFQLRRDAINAQREQTALNIKALEQQAAQKRLELAQRRQDNTTALVAVGVLALTGVAAIAVWRSA